MQLKPLRALVSVLALLGFVAAFAPGGATQTTWYVDDDACPGPGSGTALDPFCKIQDGVVAAINGDTVLVAPGTYVENINFIGKTITVSSTDGSATTIIDGNANTTVSFGSGEGRDSVLEGFTITNGKVGVVCANGSSPTIRGNVITRNINPNDSGGGLICGAKSCPLIENNVISENTALSPLTHGGGGGFFLSDSSPSIVCNVIVDNTALYKGGGIYCYYHSSPYIANNIIARNSVTAPGGSNGGGIACRLSSFPMIKNNTICDNYARESAGGIYIQYGTSSHTITNTIVWGNIPDAVNDCNRVSYSDIEGGCPGGTGNINSNPLFADPASGDYFLTPGSPCIDAGNPASPPDCDGSRADMGAIPAIPPDDCNGNQIPDVCDLYAGTSLDCNLNGIPDECDIASGL